MISILRNIALNNKREKANQLQDLITNMAKIKIKANDQSNSVDIEYVHHTDREWAFVANILEDNFLAFNKVGQIFSYRRKVIFKYIPTTWINTLIRIHRVQIMFKYI